MTLDLALGGNSIPFRVGEFHGRYREEVRANYFKTNSTGTAKWEAAQ